MVCGRNNYISTVTAERTKWLTKLREESALLICQLENMNNFDDLKDDLQAVTDLKCQCYKVIMQLNPKKDKDFINEILEIEECALKNDPSCNERIKKLVFTFQKKLKKSWEEIKQEARPWYLRAFIHIKKHCCCSDK